MYKAINVFYFTRLTMKRANISMYTQCVLVCVVMECACIILAYIYRYIAIFYAKSNDL